MDGFALLEGRGGMEGLALPFGLGGIEGLALPVDLGGKALPTGCLGGLAPLLAGLLAGSLVVVE